MHLFAYLQDCFFYQAYSFCLNLSYGRRSSLQVCSSSWLGGGKQFYVVFKKSNEQRDEICLLGTEYNTCHPECCFFSGKIQPTTPSPGLMGEIYGIVKRGHSCLFREVKNKS